MAKKTVTAPAMNAFDSIAQSAPPKASKKSEKPVAVVNDEVREAVDTFLKTKASIKAAEHDLALAEEIIISHVRPQQDKNARSGNFSKSYAVPGTVDGVEVTYVTSDKFSVPNDKIVQDHIKDTVGEKRFAEMFTKVRTIALRSEVVEDSKAIDKIVAACTAAGIDLATTFNVVDVLKANKDLDLKQYELTEKQLNDFRTLVKQAKPALK